MVEVILGVFWFISASFQTLPLSSYGLLRYGLLLRKTLVTLDQGHILLQYGLILTNYICNNPISK